MILEEFLQEFKMAKKRTKKDKIRASQKQNSKKSLISETISASSKENFSKINKVKKVSLYDPSFVVQDLKKTFVVTLIVLIVLGIIALLYT